MKNSNDKTKKTLIAITLAAITLAFSPNFSLGDQTAGQAAKEGAHSVKRHAKKGAHRVSEAACTGSDVECAAKKGKHRVKEHSEKVGDKVDEKTE